MYIYKKPFNLIRFISFVLVALFLTCGLSFAFTFNRAFAMPFYDLMPQPLELRARFYTSYPASTEERKTNIALAAKALDNILVAPNEEFSFNRTVGARTEKRGYKTAKIIVNGEFVDGVGGGVCQVSTTLYNAALLAGLNIIEYHPHSLPVNYVAPSFDAMVNSGWADLKFINNTHNPIILHTYTDGTVLRVEVYGEPMKEKFIRKSVITKEIPAPDYEISIDVAGEFPDLFEGESKIIKYGKAGYKSEGYIITTVNGKTVNNKKIRSDSYAPTRGKIIKGTAVREILDENTENEHLNDLPFTQLTAKIKKYPFNFRKNFLNTKKTLTNDNFYDNIS